MHEIIFLVKNSWNESIFTEILWKFSVAFLWKLKFYQKKNIMKLIDICFHEFSTRIFYKKNSGPFVWSVAVQKIK